jgi:hypothetical protein
VSGGARDLPSPSVSARYRAPESFAERTRLSPSADANAGVAFQRRLTGAVLGA